MPYVWISIVWFLALLYMTISSTNSTAKPVWFNISVVFLALGAIEAYLWINQDYRLEYVNPKGFSGKHEVLGSAPIKNNKTRTKRFYRNELIFDVIYTIDSNGLRITPPYKETNHTSSLLFFGGSFTFGTGVNDDEVIPYLVGLKTDSAYSIYNYGFGGYGPHQMLAVLEHKLEESMIKYKPKYVIYQAIIPHVSRAAGLESWGEQAAKYVLGENGEVIYQGSFQDNSVVPRQVVSQLKKSSIYRYFIERHRPINSDDIDLFIGIVDRSRKIIETRYPDCEFHVLLWYHEDKNSEEILKGLKRKRIRTHLISDILPGINGERSAEYEISKYDRHPSTLAHEMIADYVVSQIIKSSPHEKTIANE